MQCKDFETLLHLYVDGNLEASTSFELEAHLQVCASCSKEVDYLRAIMRAIESYPLLEVPEDLAEGIVNRIEQLESVSASAQEREYIFSAAEVLCNGKVSDFPKALLMILYGSAKITARLYSRTIISTLRRTISQIYMSLTRIDVSLSLRR
jgi:anti-sigma factor ChrR (cupin superfamily)